MKKTMIGIAMLLSATLLDVGILISGAVIATEVTEWGFVFGKLGQAMADNGLILPFVLTNILLGKSLIILYKEFTRKE